MTSIHSLHCESGSHSFLSYGFHSALGKSAFIWSSGHPGNYKYDASTIMRGGDSEDGIDPWIVIRYWEYRCINKRFSVLRIFI